MIYQGLLRRSLEKYYPYWTVSFDLRPREIVSDYRNILLVNKRGVDGFAVEGARIPGIYLIRNTSQLLIATTLNGEYLTIVTPDLPVGIWSNVIVSQTPVNHLTYNFKVELDQVTIHEEMNTHPVIFDNVDIYTSDPWHKAAPVDIRNIDVLSQPCKLHCFSGTHYHLCPFSLMHIINYARFYLCLFSLMSGSKNWRESFLLRNIF